MDELTALFIKENQFVEVVAAPSFSPEALKAFNDKKNIRLLEVKNLKKKVQAVLDIIQLIRVYFLQSIDIGEIGFKDLKIVSKRKANETEIDNSIFAWKVCKYVKSNAIVYAKDKQTLGIGADR